MTAMDIIGQRFRALESTILEERGWSVARHVELVPETRASLVTPGLRAMMAAAERQCTRLKQDLWRRPRGPHWRPWSGYANQGRSPDEASRHGNADDLPCAVDQAPKEEGKSKSKGKSKGGNRKKGGR